ncbi:MAG: hypothetical protein COA33_004090 [Fluviicola sp.]|nr:hypothetical protein [Fluviicola sp.]
MATLFSVTVGKNYQMKHILYVISILILKTSFCQVRQVNIDSLENHINTNFTKVQDQKHLMESFSVFESKDKSEAVHIYMGSLNNPSEYIGLCVIYYKFDSLHRVTSIEGWNSKGEPSYWDFAPLSTFQYVDYSNSNLIKKLQQIIPDFNSSFATFTIIIEQEIHNDSNSMYNQTNYRISSSGNKWKLRYYSNPTKGIRTVCDSTWFVLKHMDSTNHIDSEYFIGLDTLLIDGNHTCSSFYSEFALSFNDEELPPKYCIAKKYTEGMKREIKYFDKKNKLVYTKTISSGPIPIFGRSHESE